MPAEEGVEDIIHATTAVTERFVRNKFVSGGAGGGAVEGRAMLMVSSV